MNLFLKKEDDENKCADNLYFDVPLIKLTLKHVKSGILFTVDIVGWLSQLDVHAKGLILHNHRISSQQSVPFIDTLYRIAHSETFISTRFCMMQKRNTNYHYAKHFEYLSDFKKLAILLTQRLPKTLFLGLNFVGNYVPDLYDTDKDGVKQLSVNVICNNKIIRKCADCISRVHIAKRMSIIDALNIIKNRTCLECECCCNIQFSFKTYTSAYEQPVLNFNTSTSFEPSVAPSFKIKPNQFFDETYANALQHLIYDKSDNTITNNSEDDSDSFYTHYY